jgi:hypothetical protein
MNGDTLLLRQIHPTFVQHGRVTSQAFRPTPKDEQRLSVYDGNKITQQDAWQHYTQVLGHASSGVMAVSVEECTALDLPAIADPTPFPEHVVIDFSAFEKRQIETKAKLLKAKAEVRDWLYRETAG